MAAGDVHSAAGPTNPSCVGFRALVMDAGPIQFPSERNSWRTGDKTIMFIGRRRAAGIATPHASRP